MFHPSLYFPVQQVLKNMLVGRQCIMELAQVVELLVRRNFQLHPPLQRPNLTPNKSTDHHLYSNCCPQEASLCLVQTKTKPSHWWKATWAGWGSGSPATPRLKWNCDVCMVQELAPLSTPTTAKNAEQPALQEQWTNVAGNKKPPGVCALILHERWFQGGTLGTCYK